MGVRVTEPLLRDIPLWGAKAAGSPILEYWTKTPNDLILLLSLSSDLELGLLSLLSDFRSFPICTPN